MGPSERAQIPIENGPKLIVYEESWVGALGITKFNRRKAFAAEQKKVGREQSISTREQSIRCPTHKEKGLPRREALRTKKLSISTHIPIKMSIQSDILEV